MCAELLMSCGGRPLRLLIRRSLSGLGVGHLPIDQGQLWELESAHRGRPRANQQIGRDRTVRSAIRFSRGAAMKIAPLIASFVLLAPTLAAAWTPPAHQAITQAAQDRLDPGPRKALAKILQGTNVLSPGVLASVATWPDDVRARAQHGTIPDQWTSADIAEADQFNV